MDDHYRDALSSSPPLLQERLARRKCDNFRTMDMLDEDDLTEPFCEDTDTQSRQTHKVAEPLCSDVVNYVALRVIETPPAQVVCRKTSQPRALKKSRKTLH